MQITPKNQQDSNNAEVMVTVGCGLDGAEGNEPSFTYVINPDGVSITRDTDDGQVIGGVDLSVLDLDALCGTPQSEPGPKLVSAVSRMLEQSVGVRVYVGEEAKSKLHEYLKQVWKTPGTGKVWGFNPEGFIWTEVGIDDSNALLCREMVTVDGANEHESWKYTYYPALYFGTYVSDVAVNHD